MKIADLNRGFKNGELKEIIQLSLFDIEPAPHKNLSTN